VKRRTAILVFAGFALNACSKTAAPPAAKSGVTLRDLGAVTDLQAAFNRDSGDERLILLLSPT